MSEEDAARYDALAEKIDQDDVTDEEWAEFNALEEKERQTAYSDDQRGHAGVIASIGYDGEIKFDAGLVRPEDMDAAVEAGVCNRRPSSSGAEGAGKPKEKKLYAQALAADMAAIRTSAVQAALLEKPALALDILTFVLAAQDSHTGVDICHVSGGYGKARNDPDDATMSLPDFPTFENENITGYQPNLAKGFEAFRALPKKEKTAILTSCIARSIEGCMPGLVDFSSNPEGNGGLFEAIAALSGADIRKHWTPDEAFFKRLKKPQLAKAVADTLGDAEKVDQISRAKHKDAASSVAKLFADPEAKTYGLTKEQIARVKAWTPEKMAFAVDEGG